MRPRFDRSSRQTVSRARTGCRPGPTRLRLESLEERWLPAAFFFSTGNPDGLMAMASRPSGNGKIEIEAADDFILTQPTSISGASFVGLLPVNFNVTQVVVEIYRVFPRDSDVSRTSGAPTFSTPQVPTRANSPSDVALVSRDSSFGELTFQTAVLSNSFTAANSMLNGIHPKPNQTTGGEGPVTAQEVQLSISFSTALRLPADHYFFVPQVLLGASSQEFYWLSAPKPIVPPGTPISPDLQAWIRNENLAPDWLRVGTDIVGGTTPPTFNATFTLQGQTLDLPHSIAVGAGAGGAPEVKVLEAATGTPRYDFLAYPAGFRGGARVALGDVTGDLVPDIVTGAGPGGGPQVNVYDGTTGNLLIAFDAYAPAFPGGVYVAVGDVNDDGFGDVITGAGAGGGPHVLVYSGKDLVQGVVTPLDSFFAYAPEFPGGVRVAAGDVNADHHADIVTGAGPGGGPHVEVFSGQDGSLLQSFMAYDPAFAGGVFVAAGDLDNDAFADVITGADAGGGPHVRAFSGLDGSSLASFFAYNPHFTGGVRVGVLDANGDGRLDILTGAGPGGGPHVRVVDRTGVGIGDGFDSFMAFNPIFTGGVFVGGA